MSESPPIVLAAGWATVDLERAADELAALLAPGATFRPAAPSDVLGARCLVGRTEVPDAPAPVIVLLEPATEGRLAAALARHGEGWCVTWLRPTSGDAAARDDALARPGPLGPERLEPGSPGHGPFRLIVATATIAP